jgi:hypothetical protein
LDQAVAGEWEAFTPPGEGKEWRIETDSLPSATRWAYASLFTHLLTLSAPVTGGIRALVRRVSEWSAKPDWQEKTVVATCLGELLTAGRLLLPETFNG